MIKLRRIFLASAFGTILEWYDFSLFAFLTPLLAGQFFPKQNPITGALLIYLIFAIGFFVRPLGAIIFGHLGDRIGRKKTLIISIVLMTMATAAIGLLPTYKHIGIYAPLLLIALRIAQGLSVAGESTGAMLFILEAENYKSRGFIGGLLWAVVSVGMLGGSAAATVAIHFSHYDWIWRIPFLLGIITGLLAYFMRKHTPETSMFQDALDKATLVKAPLYTTIVRHKIAMLRIIGIYTLSAMLTYLIFIFMPTYAANLIGLPIKKVTIICTLTLAGTALLIPLIGYLSDLIGRKILLCGAAIAIFIFSYPLFCLIKQNSLAYFIIAQIFFMVLAASFQGVINSAVTEQLPTSVRFSGIAVGYNLAYSLFGGTAPVIANYLVKVSGNMASPGLYLMCGALAAILATYNMPETNRIILSQIAKSSR